MKKKVLSALSLLLAMSVLTTSLTTVQAIEPRYAGVSQISSILNISGFGGASCRGQAILRDGYTADVIVELKQDGETIKTWTASGSGVVTASGTYYVLSGHDYVVTTTVNVYNSRGNLVESPSVDSTTSSY